MTKTYFAIGFLLSLAWTNPSLAENDEAVIERLKPGFAANPTHSLFISQADRRIVLKNYDKLVTTRPVIRGEKVYPLTDEPADFSDVSYEVDGTAYTLDEFLAMPSHIGLIVVRGDKVLLEHYQAGNDASTRWVSFSVSKSVTSMLVGAAIQDGFIRSVDEPVAHYLPRLRGTPYEASTIRNVLNMASGLKWNEDYGDSNSDVAIAGAYNGIELVSYLSKLPREHEPGEVFNYNTGETNLVGELLRSAIGNNASTYLTYKIWQPFGMEYDANWRVTGHAGGETGGCCISATLRDYARLGIFAMRGGKLQDGTEVLPEGWMKESTTPSKGNPGYGYQWWLNPDGNYSAIGIFGQGIHIFPEQNLVIAMHNNAPVAGASEFNAHIRGISAAIANTLK